MEVPSAALEAVVAVARAMGCRGFNCSMPHKRAIIRYLDQLTTNAELSGTVNCVVRSDDGRLTRTNTDRIGFLHALRQVLDPRCTNAACSAQAAPRVLLRLSWLSRAQPG